MMDSTMVMLLKRYKQKDESNEATTYTEQSPQQKEEEYRNNISTLLSNYEEKDKESPDTETDSQVDSGEISSSDEEIIDYNVPSNINRDDLPTATFNFTNKDHVERVIESAKSMIF